MKSKSHFEFHLLLSLKVKGNDCTSHYLLKAEENLKPLVLGFERRAKRLSDI